MNDENHASADTLGHLLQLRAAQRVDHPLLVCDDDVLTYAAAASASADLARGLIAAGVSCGSRVGLLHPNGPAFVVAALAAARVGAIAVPLSTFSTPDELGVLLRNASVELLLAGRGFRRNNFVTAIAAALPDVDLHRGAPFFSAAVPSLRRVVFDSSDPDLIPACRLGALVEAGVAVDPVVLRSAEDQVTPADHLVIVHTSGSTAEPKGVIHVHRSLLEHQRTLNRMRGFSEEDVLFCNSPFFWIGGYAYALLATIESGGTLVCSNAPTPAGVLDVIERTRPTMVNGFAQAVAHLPADPSFPDRDLSSIRRGNLYPVMAPEVRPADPELRHNMLGMTETGSVCLALADESDQPESRRGSFGRPVPGLEALIVDVGTGRPLPPGQTGELCLRGPALMEGYCGRERHETFDRDGWYHSGDLFHTDADDLYYFHGRSSEMIKTSGANVSPREVEAVVLEETGLVAHVFGLDDPRTGQVVTAVVRVPAGGEPPDPDDLTARLRKRLSAYKVPKRILLIDDADVPVMSSGKVDLRALKDQARDH